MRQTTTEASATRPTAKRNARPVSDARWNRGEVSPRGPCPAWASGRAATVTIHSWCSRGRQPIPVHWPGDALHRFQSRHRTESEHLRTRFRVGGAAFVERAGRTPPECGQVHRPPVPPRGTSGQRPSLGSTPGAAARLGTLWCRNRLGALDRNPSVRFCRVSTTGVLERREGQ